jgi:serine/threonine protein kinase/tetratricopeptide (TPR) repeat protein
MLGETISHYRIIENLGEGGMGIVYRAVDSKLDREVAIKLLPAHLSSDTEAVKRFIHEAKAASAIDHSNIGTIYEIDETEDGVTFIVMALYDGETLRQRIDRGDISVEEALDIASQIASGLSKAHRKDIVHRDIKPSNIIITSDGDVKIIDFGLAKLAGLTKLTKEASTLGTAAYMSPEQARGGTVDSRSDIFSLGVILYEMLAGEPPFRGEHEAALLYEVVHEKPRPLSSCRSELSAGLQQIIEKILEKNVGERYQNINDLLEDLSAIREKSESRTPAKESKRYTSASSHHRANILRSIAIPAVVIITVLVGIVIMRNYRVLPPVNEYSVAVIDFRDLGNTEDDTQSAGFAGLLHIGLVESSPCRVISPQLLYDLRRRLFGAGSGPIGEDQSLEVARECNATFLLSGQMLISGSSPYIIWHLVETETGKSISGSRVEGENLAVLADQVITRVVPLIALECGLHESPEPTSVGEMTTQFPEAYDHYIEGIMAAASRDNQEAVPELERAVSIDSTFALAYYQLSKIHFFILGGAGQHELAQEYAEMAWKYRARLGSRDRMRLEAWREQIYGRVEDALDICREMLLRWPDDRDLLKELSRKYTFYWYFDKGLEIATQGISYYPDDYDFVYRAAACLSFMDRRREALELTRSYAERHAEDAFAWVGVAIRYIELAMPDSAEIAAQRALENDPSSFYAQGIAVDCEYLRGNLEGAIDSCDRLLARDDLLDSQRILILTNIVYYMNLPLLYMEGGQYDKAIEQFEKARQFVSDPGDEISIESNLNRILLRMGHADRVKRWAQAFSERTEDRRGKKPGEILRIRALVALDSLETARSSYHQYVADNIENGVGLADLYPQDKLRAEIALAENDPETAITALGNMKRRGMTYGAGLWYIEWREMLARAYRMAGRLEEAAEVHEDMLREFRSHFISHYELGKIYEEMGRNKDAIDEYERFLEMWSQADEGLPQLEDAKSRLEYLGGV